MPVGPPWMTTSSGYLRGSLVRAELAPPSTGLCRTPSIVVPSWLFHDTTSSVLVAQLRVCALKSVSLIGGVRLAGGVRLKPDATSATNTSPIDFASLPINATIEPSCVKLNVDRTDSSDAASRRIVFVAGSNR